MVQHMFKIIMAKCGVVGTSCLAFSVSPVDDVPRDIPCVLSARNIPSVELASPLAKRISTRGLLNTYFIEM
jgi:hypothetical protein